MRVSIDWFDFLNNKTCSAHYAFADVVTLPQALTWLKNVVQSMQLDYEHIGQVVVDGYNREDLKAKLFCKSTFVVSRKPYEHKDKDDPRSWFCVAQHYEYWSGNESWGEYAQARHYDSKDVATSIMEAIAMHREFVYQVEEVDEYGFVFEEVDGFVFKEDRI